MSSSSEEDNLDTFLSSLKSVKREKYRYSSGSLDDFVVSDNDVSFADEDEDLDQSKLESSEESGGVDISSVRGTKKSDNSNDRRIGTQASKRSLLPVDQNFISDPMITSKSKNAQSNERLNNYSDFSDSGAEIRNAPVENSNSQNNDPKSTLRGGRLINNYTGDTLSDSRNDEKKIQAKTGWISAMKHVNIADSKTTMPHKNTGRNKHLEKLRARGSFTPKHSTAGSVSKSSTTASKIIFSSDSDDDDSIFIPDAKDATSISPVLKNKTVVKTLKKSSRMLLLSESDEETIPSFSEPVLRECIPEHTSKVSDSYSKPEDSTIKASSTKIVVKTPKKSSRILLSDSDQECCPSLTELDLKKSRPTPEKSKGAGIVARSNQSNDFTSDANSRSDVLLRPLEGAGCRSNSFLPDLCTETKASDSENCNIGKKDDLADSLAEIENDMTLLTVTPKGAINKVSEPDDTSKKDSSLSASLRSPEGADYKSENFFPKAPISLKKSSKSPRIPARTSAKKSSRILVLSDDSSDDDLDNDVIFIDEDLEDKENHEKNIPQSPDSSASEDFSSPKIYDNVFETPDQVPKKRSTATLFDDDEYVPLMARILGDRVNHNRPDFEETKKKTNFIPRRTSEPKPSKIFATPSMKPPKICQTEKSKGARGNSQSRSNGIPPGLPLNCEKGVGFKRNRDTLTKRLYDFFNETVFSNTLPLDMIVEWDKRLRKTAGVTKCSTRTVTSFENGIRCVSKTYSARISLSEKVLDNLPRLRDTLCHEMCHAAVWLLDHQNDGHGPYWKAWARKATVAHPEMPVVKRCHSYDISYKYQYQCQTCRKIYGRHSKSIKVDKQACGVCRGRLILLPKTKDNGTPAKPRQPNKFAMFVKENYKITQKSNSIGGMTPKHSDVMKALSAQFASLSTKK